MTGAEGAIRLAIVDDHPVVLAGTAALLNSQKELRVVGTASSIEEASSLLDPDEVDVLLLDVRLGSESGLSLLSDRSGARRPAVVVLTAYDYPQYEAAALRLGAAGFVAKTAPVAELVDAIRRAAAGGLAFAHRPGGTDLPRFSTRELEVVRLVVDGHSNDEIGSRLGIASKTVEARLRRIFERLGLQSRTELATRALREGWLDVPAESIRR